MTTTLLDLARLLPNHPAQDDACVARLKERLADLPGVKITPVDAYGLNNMQGGQKGMRVRGEVSTHGVSGTVEGLALNGPGPGPGVRRGRPGGH